MKPVFSATIQVRGRVQLVRRECQKPLDADAKRFKCLFFQPLTDTDPVFGTPFHCPHDERLSPISFEKPSGAEQEEETAKVFRGRESLRAAPTGVPEDGGQIDLVVRLIAALV